MAAQHPPIQLPTVRAARAAYFAANGFGADGGYAARWVHFKLGPLPLAIPNGAGRVRAVRYHDLHHLVTGYGTDFHGEFEISAWEIGAGCKGYAAAWVINLSGLVGGLLFCPRRAVAAFLRGRSMDTLYGRPLEPMLDGTLAALCGSVGAARLPENMTAANFVRLLGASLAGLGLGLGLLGSGLVFAPVLALCEALVRRAEHRPVAGAPG